MEHVPVLLASSTGLPGKRAGWPTKSLVSAPRNGHKVGMPLQASSPLSLSVSCDMATPCLAGWCSVHLSIAHVHITPCPIIH